MISITPRIDADCNATNGLVPNQRYTAWVEGSGYVVRIANGGERLIPPDGDGAGHLQYRKVIDRYTEEVRTAGHFEIEVI